MRAHAGSLSDISTRQDVDVEGSIGTLLLPRRGRLATARAAQDWE